MAEEAYGFDQARARLEEIATQVRKKDVSLEKSLDLLEEGVRLANLCTEQIDQTQWRSVIEAAEPAEGAGEEPEPAADEAVAEAEPRADQEPGGELEGAWQAATQDDVPGEDTHASAEDAPAEDPDVEA